MKTTIDSDILTQVFVHLCELRDGRQTVVSQLLIERLADVLKTDAPPANTVSLYDGRVNAYAECGHVVIFSNRTQAQKKCDALGRGWSVWQSPLSRRFLVVKC